MNRKCFIMLIAIVPLLLQAQTGLLDKMNTKLKNKATARVDKKMDQVIDKTLDEIEGKNGRAHVPSSSQKVSTDILRSYVKYDFVAGEQVIYSNDFETENMGELPVGWNSNGSAAVVRLTDLPGNWMQFYQNASYLTDNKENFSENFTIEFDLLLRRSNPKAAFPMLAWGILSSGSLPTTDNELLKNPSGTFATELKMQPYDNNGSYLQLESFLGRKSYLKTDIRKFALQQYFNKIIHVAVQVQKERLRIWFNEEKVFDLPKAIAPAVAINQVYFSVKRYGAPESEVGYNISHIKIAKGLPDTRHKLVDEGKLSTTGILFDINSATIRPESNGVLNEIGNVLQQLPQLKMKIIGHTDSDGNDKVNLELSRKRAQAVKEFFVKNFQIDGTRIEADGAGESMPVTDNTTKEGKANNRRVEFIKL